MFLRYLFPSAIPFRSPQASWPLLQEIDIGGYLLLGESCYHGQAQEVEGIKLPSDERLRNICLYWVILKERGEKNKNGKLYPFCHLISLGIVILFSPFLRRPSETVVCAISLTLGEQTKYRKRLGRRQRNNYSSSPSLKCVIFSTY